jgi:hypothetical protein
VGVKRLLLLVALWTAACSTTQSRFATLGDALPPRSEDCNVAVYLEEAPERNFVRVSRLDVHVEHTLFHQAGLTEALPELRRQACLSGADAIIEIQEREQAIVENRSYHVIAVGIRYTR